MCQDVLGKQEGRIMEATHIVHIGYKTYTGSRRERHIPCFSLEEAERELERQVKEIDEEFLIYSRIEVLDKSQQVAEPIPKMLHYKITAKDSFGGAFVSIVPASEDLEKMLGMIDEDLKVISIEKVALPTIKAMRMVTDSRAIMRG